MWIIGLQVNWFDYMNAYCIFYVRYVRFGFIISLLLLSWLLWYIHSFIHVVYGHVVPIDWYNIVYLMQSCNHKHTHIGFSSNWRRCNLTFPIFQLSLLHTLYIGSAISCIIRSALSLILPLTFSLFFYNFHCIKVRVMLNSINETNWFNFDQSIWIK